MLFIFIWCSVLMLLIFSRRRICIYISEGHKQAFLVTVTMYWETDSLERTDSCKQNFQTWQKNNSRSLPLVEILKPLKNASINFLLLVLVSLSCVVFHFCKEIYTNFRIEFMCNISHKVSNIHHSCLTKTLPDKHRWTTDLVNTVKNSHTFKQVQKTIVKPEN